MTDLSNRIRARLTYANVVATLALTVAMGTGGAYAASKLDKNSVGPKQLRKNAVGSRALKNGAVGARDLSSNVQRRLLLRASVNSDGTVRDGRVKASRSDPNTFTVTFKRDVASCIHVASLLSFASLSDPQSGSASISGVGGKDVTVTTFDSAGAPVPAAFNLIVAC